VEGRLLLCGDPGDSRRFAQQYLDHTGLEANRTLRSFRLHRNPTSSSCGFTRCLSYLPPNLETPFLLIAPVLGIAGLAGLPFYAGEGEKSWHKRPVAIIMLTTVAVAWAVLTHLGTFTPWSPKMNCMERRSPYPHPLYARPQPAPTQRRIVFQSKQCRNCHSIAGVGGMRGPALDLVATRLTEDQLIRQVLQGGGNMPAYGKNLSPSETTALVRFLETLHPSINQQPQMHRVRQP